MIRGPSVGYIQILLLQVWKSRLRFGDGTGKVLLMSYTFIQDSSDVIHTPKIL